MNEWNNNEERFNSYDGCNSSGIHMTEKGSRQQGSGNRNNAQIRNKPRQENRKDSQYLAKIVQQNETIIGLLKGIKQALNSNNKTHNINNNNKHQNRKDSINVKSELPKKQYIQRFNDEKRPNENTPHKKRYKKNQKPLSGNSNVEVVEEVVTKKIPILDVDFTSENEVGEENPFTMFDSSNKK